MASEGGPREGAAADGGYTPAASQVELRLTGEQIDVLRREGEARHIAAGEVLFREGDRGYDFIVILAGRVAVVDHQAGTERRLATGTPGEFIAELSEYLRTVLAAGFMGAWCPEGVCAACRRDLGGGS